MCSNCAHAGVCKYTYETPEGETRSMFKTCNDYVQGQMDIPVFLREANRLGYIVRKKKK